MSYKVSVALLQDSYTIMYSVCVIIDLCMAISWSRVADMTQRTVSLALSGLTLVGLAVLARGGYGVLQRKNQRAALEQQKNVSHIFATTAASPRLHVL